MDKKEVKVGIWFTLKDNPLSRFPQRGKLYIVLLPPWGKAGMGVMDNKRGKGRGRGVNGQKEGKAGMGVNRQKRGEGPGKGVNRQ
jgi:hypothetical protein